MRLRKAREESAKSTFQPGEFGSNVAMLIRCKVGEEKGESSVRNVGSRRVRCRRKAADMANLFDPFDQSVVGFTHPLQTTASKATPQSFEGIWRSTPSNIRTTIPIA